MWYLNIMILKLKYFVVLIIFGNLKTFRLLIQISFWQFYRLSTYRIEDLQLKKMPRLMMMKWFVEFFNWNNFWSFLFQMYPLKEPEILDMVVNELSERLGVEDKDLMKDHLRLLKVHISSLFFFFSLIFISGLCWISAGCWRRSGSLSLPCYHRQTTCFSINTSIFIICIIFIISIIRKICKYID